jgi:uncharacterized radical SAM superfamily protein
LTEKVLLVHPPFFRLAGSHNDRAPVELTYYARIMQKAGIENVVYNADYTGASKFWRWRHLSENYDVFRQGVKATNPLIYELFELLMSYEPTVAIIAGGDSFLASVDTGNPFVAAHLGRLFKKYGVYVIGIGHFFALDKVHFLDSWDAMIPDGPNSGVLDVIRERRKGVCSIGGLDTGLVPYLSSLEPKGQLPDQVMTSKGCIWSCTFCKAGLMTKKLNVGVQFRDPTAISLDITQRSLDSYYLADMVFSADKDHLEKMANSFEKFKINKEFKKYTVEDKVDVIDEEKCALMERIGVSKVKIGLELFDDEALKRYNKHYETHHVVSAVKLYRKYGMKVVAYLMIGGPNIPSKAYLNTIEFCKEIDFDSYVISVYAYWNQNKRDFSEDSHFSPDAIKTWDIDPKVVDELFKLQESKGGNFSLKNYIG